MAHTLSKAEIQRRLWSLSNELKRLESDMQEPALAEAARAEHKRVKARRDELYAVFKLMK